MDSCIALITKSLPLGMPTAWLYGRRWVENFSRREQTTWLAMSQRIAVGIPTSQEAKVDLINFYFL
jgi:hypothetical protein